MARPPGYRLSVFLRTLMEWPRANAAYGRQMQAPTRLDRAELQAVSGYRRRAWQDNIICHEVARFSPVEALLHVSVLPGSGFSEHHTGRAIDIAEPTTPPAETIFEHTDAFAWLQGYGSDFGFRLSYPRGNGAGMMYEPWHWYWRGV